MKTVDFESELMPNGHIAVPQEFASQVPAGEQIQVVLRWGVSEGDADWCAAGRRPFEAAYADDDSVCEQLIHDASSR